MTKNCSGDRENLLKNEAEGQDFAKTFEITGTIYSNIERSEKILVAECFFNLFLELINWNNYISNWEKKL